MLGIESRIIKVLSLVVDETCNSVSTVKEQMRGENIDRIFKLKREGSINRTKKYFSSSLL